MSARTETGFAVKAKLEYTSSMGQTNTGVSGLNIEGLWIDLKLQTVSEQDKARFQIDNIINDVKTALENSLNTDLAVDNFSFIPPGNAFFKYSHIRFTENFDLVMDVIYSPPTPNSP